MEEIKKLTKENQDLQAEVEALEDDIITLKDKIETLQKNNATTSIFNGYHIPLEWKTK